MTRAIYPLPGILRYLITRSTWGSFYFGHAIHFEADVNNAIFCFFSFITPLAQCLLYLVLEYIAWFSG